MEEALVPKQLDKGAALSYERGHYRKVYALFERLAGGMNMGKGDIRTRRGKTCRGTYGNTRPKKKKVKAKEKVTVQVATKAPRHKK